MASKRLWLTPALLFWTQPHIVRLPSLPRTYGSWFSWVANFIAFLKAIHIPTVPTEMTFGVSRDGGLFEWSGTSLATVFSQRKNIFSLRMWRMIFDIIRFNQFALDLLQNEENSEQFNNGISNGNGVHQTKTQETIGQYLERQGYSDAFRDDYLIPMTAAVWSTSPDKCSLEFPAITLVRFMQVTRKSIKQVKSLTLAGGIIIF